MTVGNDFIYLDNNASTPVDPLVQAVMDKHATLFGNPHSGHFLGALSRKALDTARMQVMSAFGLSTSEWTCVFTSGASESNNLAIKGVCMHSLRTQPEKPFQIITSAVEHASVDKCVDYLAELFGKSRIHSYRIPVDEDGIVDLSDAERILGGFTSPGLISCIQTVAETGAVEPVAQLAKLTKQIAPSFIFHCDASQSVGKLGPEQLRPLGSHVDMITVAGHKFGAPKGVGALLVRNSVKTRLDPLIHGAGQEFGVRGGTENVLFAVALGAACELASATTQSSELKNLLWEIICEEFKSSDRKVDFRLNSTAPTTSPLTINFSVAGINGPDVVSALGNAHSGDIKICFSAGSACHSRGCPTPSKVLAAMRIDPKYATSGLRLSLSRHTTGSDVRLAGPLIAKHIVNVL